MLETLFGSALVKAATVLAGLTITTGAAAAADALPQVAQDKVASAMELVLPLDIPDSADAAKDKRSEGQKVAEEHKAPEVDDQEVEAAEQEDAGDADNFGQTVAGDAKSGLPQQDGRAFGEKVSSNAPKAPQATTARPTQTPTADSNPGTTYRESTPAPETQPTADSNPGSSYRDSAPTGQPEDQPTAESNPGTKYRP